MVFQMKTLEICSPNHSCSSVPNTNLALEVTYGKTEAGTWKRQDDFIFQNLAQLPSTI